MLDPFSTGCAMILLNILWPTFALVLLIFFVMFSVAVRRLGHIRRVPPGPGTFATRDTAAAYFAPVELPANNLANLFEMPVLFFALVPLLIETRSAGVAQVLLAWLFVLARLAHSYLHIVGKDVRARFRAFLVGNALLSAMWNGFFVDMARAAHAYTQAMGAMGVQP